MPSSTRLDDETEAVLQKAANLLGVTKSQIVRESIRNYCERVIHENEKRTPWEIYQSIHKEEADGSEHGMRIQNTKEILKNNLDLKRKKWSL